MSEELEIINKRIEVLTKDYQNIVATINRLDKDRDNLITRGVQTKGAIDELQTLKVQLETSTEEQTVSESELKQDEDKSDSDNQKQE